MRILIGTAEIAGWLNQLRVDLEGLGHKVTTAVQERNPYYKYDYDIYLTEKFDSYRLLKTGISANIFMRIFNKIQNLIAYHFFGKYISRLIDEHDIVIRLWDSFLPDSRENRIIREKGKKLIILFVGSDIRNYNTFSQQYDIARWTFPNAFIVTSMEDQLIMVRHAEKYADSIYSVPDQAGLQLRPYHHLPVPVPVEKCRYVVHGRQVPKILHAPSVPYKKGTDIIEGTIERLRAEGLQFEFISIRDQPHEKVLELLTDADILVDEIVFHGPGALSFEAMLSGCAVATRYLEDSPACFRPPVCSINADNIQEKLRELIQNPAMVRDMAERGRKYALENNDSRRFAADIIQRLGMDRDFDYIPTFLRDKYIPANSREAALINKWTAFVRDTDWYRKLIKPSQRDGLEF